ncbi:NUDIX hydrolase [uncultured Tyzzerella sp.]|uniref:NUDIX hydrolase n=1 Tax=uncultured Tyzzerella sp. TaxID=2321398 RepID=UPI002942E847|nr:NUDIX hydrolase [uncultured Tyzzerella sp.]
MKNPYETIDSKVSFNGKIIDVKVDTISLPDGKTAKREVVLRGDATAIVPIDEKGNVILVKQYRHPAESIVLEIPAGMLEEGEDPKVCAIRELEEETSLIAKDLTHITTMYPAVGFCTEKLHIYLAKDLEQGNFNFDDDEFIEVIKVPLDEAIDMIYTGKIIDSKTIVGLLACKRFL